MSLPPEVRREVNQDQVMGQMNNQSDKVLSYLLDFHQMVQKMGRKNASEHVR